MNKLPSGAKRVVPPVITAVMAVALSLHPSYGQDCIDDLTMRVNNCTANDVVIAELTVINVIDGCTSGTDFATIDLRAELVSGPDRYDIGIFFALDGGNARTGTCLHDWLNPIALPPAHDPVGGSGPFANLENFTLEQGQSPDICGDIIAGQSTFVDLNQTVTVPCTDIDIEDGLLEIASCLSWDNQRKRNCFSLNDAVPGTKAKCNCENNPTTVKVPQLALTKSCVPGTARPGETVQCTIQYTNNTQLAAADFISFSDDYDQSKGTVSNISVPGSDSVSDDGDVILWTPGGAPATDSNIPPGGTGTMTYDFTLSASLLDGETVVNTVTTRWNDTPQPPTATHTTNVTTTDAMITDVRRGFEDGQPTLQFTTASENRTVAFWLEVETADGWQRLHEESIPAALVAPQGSRYRLPLGYEAATSEVLNVKIVEVETDGGHRVHGPFAVSQSRDELPLRRRSSTASAMWSSAEPRVTLGRRTSEGTPAPANDSAGERLERASRLQFSTPGPGIFEITDKTLAESLGVSVQSARTERLSGRLQLRDRQGEVPWTSTAAGLLFYSPPYDSTDSQVRSFILSRAPGTRMQTANRGPLGSAGVTGRASLRVEENLVPLVTAGLGPDDDFWMWQGLAGSAGATAEIEFDVSDPVSSGSAELRLGLVGVLTTATHGVDVLINGQKVAGLDWQGRDPFLPTVEIPARLLRAGRNVVTLVTNLDRGAQFPGLFLDFAELDHERTLRLGSGSLLFTAVEDTTALQGLSTSDSYVFDVTDLRAPQLVETEAAPTGSTWSSSFASEAGRQYAATTSPQRLTRLRRIPDEGPLQTSLLGAEYLIVTSDDLRSAARDFARHRESQGWSTAVVTTQEIFDEWNAGEPSARALHDALRDIHRLGFRTLQQVLLLGQGTLDHRNDLGLGTNKLPVLLTTTKWGFFASDGLFTDFDGDGAPELPIGRIPAVSAEEALNVLAKIEEFETPGSWQSRSLWVADDQDKAGDFAAASRILADLSEDPEVALFGSLQQSTVEAMRRSIAGGFEEGYGLVNYVGHGGIDVLANESFFSASDALGLQPTGLPPVTVALTCNIGRFELPGFTPLSSHLLMGRGGAVAVLSPSGPSENHEAVRLGSAFHEAWLSDGLTLGESFLRSVKKTATTESSKVYNLLGDPALQAPRQ